MTLMDRIPLPEFSTRSEEIQLALVQEAQRERYSHWQEAASKQKRSGGGAKKTSGGAKKSSSKKKSSPESLKSEISKMSEAEKQELKKKMGLI
jgi:hypothetical protein